MPRGFYVRSLEQIENMAKAQIGNSNAKGHIGWNTGLTKETDNRLIPSLRQIEKDSESIKEWHRIHKHPRGMLNKIHSEETKEKQKVSRKKYLKTHKHPMDGTHCSDETKTKLRLAKIKSIEKNYGQCWPSYNPEACEYFRQFDKDNNTKGQYAMYGGGEYKIESLGYFVDYINFDLKLIMEYDESRHYHLNGKLKKKDRIRQDEIQKVFSDFEFRRIKK
jgi:hypothetical protein